MNRYKKPEDITVGVVGYGGAFNMGREHLKHMRNVGMTPLAVAEVDPSRLEIAKTEFPGIETYSSVAAMLKKSAVDLVVLITPHNTHAPLALQCLRAGRHVICEKPMAITTAEVDVMIAAAKKTRAMLSTYHNRHWDGRIRLAKEYVADKKAIGEVIRVECHMGGYRQPGDWWRSSRTISGGILYDWGVHLLEYGLQLIDSRLTEVSGFAHAGYWSPKTKWKADTNEDEAFAVARFKSGQWLTLCMSSIDSKGKEGMVEVTGTDGTFLLEGNQGKLIQHRDGAVVTTQIPNPADESVRYYENIVAHLVNGEKLVITPEWSRRPIHIIDLAIRSAKAGRAMKAKYG